MISISDKSCSENENMRCLFSIYFTGQTVVQLVETYFRGHTLAQMVETF
jgi:hypothetical protein